MLVQQQPSETAKSLTEEAMCKQFTLSKENFIVLQSAFCDLHISLNQQSGSTASNSTLSTQAECKRVLAALGALVFQLKSLRGREGKLMVAASVETGAKAPNAVQLLQNLHAKCAEIARETEGGECNREKFMKSLADTLYSHIQTFSKTVYPLIG